MRHQEAEAEDLSGERKYYLAYSTRALDLQQKPLIAVQITSCHALPGSLGK